MNRQILNMAQRAYDEDNMPHLRAIRDRLDALYERAPVPEVLATLRAVDDLLGQLRRDRAAARRA